MPSRPRAPVVQAYSAGRVPYSTLGPMPPGFTLGTTKPDVTNTGYGVLGYSPASLTDVPKGSAPAVSGVSANGNGDIIITANNTLLQGYRFHAMVQINASNCTVQGCHIVSYVEHPYPGTSNYGLISTAGTGNTVAYNEITLWDSWDNTDNSGYTAVGGVVPYWGVGVLLTGGSTSVFRNNIHDVNDCTYITAGTHQIQGNYLHDPMFRTDDGDQSGSTPPSWSHNDGTQIEGGTNHLIDGNSYEWRFSTQTGMPSTANPNPLAEQVWLNAHCIIIQNQKNAISGVTIQRNWFKYGSLGVRFGGVGPADPGGAVTLQNNRFTPDQGKEFSQYRQIAVDPTTSWSVAPSVDNTNVYSTDSDTPSAIQGLPLNGNWIDTRTSNPSTSGTVKTWAYNVNAHTP